MKLRIGDVVLCEDLERPGNAFWGRVVPPIEKHEIRQCRTTDLVVIQADISKRRRVSDGEEVVWHRTKEVVWRTTKSMRQNGMAVAFGRSFGIA